MQRWLGALIVGPMLVVAGTNSEAAAGVPRFLPFQGMLRDGAGVPVAQGSLAVTFSLYDDASGAEKVWTESWPPDGHDCSAWSSGCVEVIGGVFSVNLGTHVPLAPDLFGTNSQLWLAMSVEGEPELPRRGVGA